MEEASKDVNKEQESCDDSTGNESASNDIKAEPNTEELTKKRSKLAALFKWKKDDGSRNHTAILFDGLGVFVIMYFFITGSTENLKFDTFAPFKEQVDGIVVDTGSIYTDKQEYFIEIEYEYNGRTYYATNYSAEDKGIEVGDYVKATINALNLKDALKVKLDD